MLAANSAHRARLRGSTEMRRLAAGVNDLAHGARSARGKTSMRACARRTRASSRRRNRLAALMSELAQSVVVCNVEGRILLYNARAMQLLRKPLDGGAAADKAHSLVGLGRSIFAIFDRNLIIHALESIRDACASARARSGRRASSPRRRPASSCACRWRRCWAPAAAEPRDDAPEGITGFVLLLDNITRRIESGKPPRSRCCRR